MYCALISYIDLPTLQNQLGDLTNLAGRVEGLVQSLGDIPSLASAIMYDQGLLMR
jgi:hypothetical protein